MGKFFGYVLAVFLAGIAVHSIWPWGHVDALLWIGAACVVIGAAYVVHPNRRAFAACVILGAFLFGAWRFDVSRPRVFLLRGRITIVKTPDTTSVLARWRNWMTARIASTLPPDEATLLTGILYGDQDLSPKLHDLFQRAGLLHLVAVSGSNVTIIVNMLFPIALGVGLRRRHAFWIVSIGLLLFVGFVGFSASVLRAAVMGWFVLLARYLGRIAWTDRLLLFAAALLSLFNPWQLAFDAGFALSFLATWGLLAWTPIFQRRLTVVPAEFGIREALATTCGATLMTAPYAAWAFGQMSLAGLLTNALALPLVPWITVFGAVAAAWGPLPGSVIVSLPAFGLLRGVLAISHLADFVPWLNVRIPSMDVFVLLAVYLLMWRVWRSLRDETELSTHSTVD